MLIGLFYTYEELEIMMKYKQPKFDTLGDMYNSSVLYNTTYNFTESWFLPWIEITNATLANDAGEFNEMNMDFFNRYFAVRIICQTDMPNPNVKGGFEIIQHNVELLHVQHVKQVPELYRSPKVLKYVPNPE